MIVIIIIIPPPPNKTKQNKTPGRKPGREKWRFGNSLLQGVLSWEHGEDLWL